MTPIKAILLTLLQTLEIFFIYWDNFESHHSEQLLKISEIFKGNICGGVPLYLNQCLSGWQ